MPTTNRPFFANFFAAFRAHSALPKASPSMTGASTSSSGTLVAATAASQSSHAQAYLHSQAQSSTGSSNLPRPISTDSLSAPHKSGHSTASTASAAVATAATASAAQSHFRSSRPLHPAPTGTPHSRTHSTSPLPPSRSADGYAYTSSSPGQSSPFGRSTTPSSSTPGPNPQFPYSPPYGPQQQRRRRGSDTSEGSGGGGSAGMWPGAEKWYIGGRTATGEERFYKLGLVRKYDSADRLSLDRLSL